MNAKIKNVNEEAKEVEETKTVAETEGAAESENKDDKPQPPVPEEPKDGFFKKVGKGLGKVGSGVKKALDTKVKLWQVIAAPVLIAGVVIGAKRIYEKGQRDAMGLPDDDNFLLPEEEDIKALTTADEEVIDVEDYVEEPEVDEAAEELDDENEEVYDEEFIEE